MASSKRSEHERQSLGTGHLYEDGSVSEVKMMADPAQAAHWMRSDPEGGGRPWRWTDSGESEELSA